MSDRKGRPPIYPWDEWLDGQLHILRQADDFPTATPRGFRANCYHAAQAKGGKAETKLIDGGVMLRYVESE